MLSEELESKIQKKIEKWFSENSEKFIDISKQIWEYAELQFQEKKSSRLLADVLEEAGFTIEMGVADIETAFVATYTNGDGFSVGTWGEYDALEGLGCKIADTYQPTGTSGHGCGHNLLGSGSAAAVIAVKNAMDELGIKGTVKYFGCPAEEGGSAKVFMVREHVFDGMDALVTWHPANANVCSMSAASAIRSVRYQFHGKAAHAGVSPQLGRSALDAAILMDVGVNYLREHVPQEVRIQSVISNGGRVPNVVPAEAEIWYNIRAPKQQDLDDIFRRMNLIANGMAMATETTVDIELGSGASVNGMPNKALSEMVLGNLEKVGGPKFDEEDWEFAKALNKEVTIGEKRQSMAQMYHIYDPSIYELDLCETISTDLMEGTVAPYSGDGSDVAWQAPLATINICCQPVGTGNHSWQQTVCSGSSIGQKGMIVAAKTMALSLTNALCDEELMKKAKEEFTAKINEYPYTCPIPAHVKPESRG